ncbi:MAG: acetyl/propionyl/methylcrotonyl-CoA carboxylase subunit alpha [Pseudomonadota bacterium]
MPFISSLLIANRGEIACRIILTARKLGVRTVAVYSEADAKARHVALADEAVCIGPAPAAESYLVIDKIIEAAKQAKAEAIHPGYGFLSERAAFAEACKKAGIIFIGPPASAITAMGAKDEAKRIMEKAGVPVVPGYHGEKQDEKFLKEQAKKIGYPVLIKAVSGGGGKGMRRVDAEKDFTEALASAQREAKNAFGDERVLIEKYVTSPRHIEIQVFADAHGNCVHLFERDCSLQRRHQKVIEEAPAPGMPEDVRKAMGAAAVAAAKAVGYVGAGTVEFIADSSKGLKADGFYFMEMNTRLQVEHPVTEAICGVDLVEWQLRIAAGEKLPLVQKDLRINGHAVEARLYAEDADHSFLPSTGKICHLRWPEATEGQFDSTNIRIDTGVREGDEVTPYYDPMLAKVIARGATRDEALNALYAALLKIEIAGPKTNLAFLAGILQRQDFVKGNFDTGFIDKNLSQLVQTDVDDKIAGAAVHALLKGEGANATSTHGWHSPWNADDQFQMSGGRELNFKIDIDGEEKTVTLPAHSQNVKTVAANGGVYVLHQGRQIFARWPDAQKHMEDHGAGQGALKAPMNGKVTLLNVKEGALVTSGDRLIVIEAMKMEHAIVTKRTGKVSRLFVTPGQQVTQGTILAEIAEG